MKKLIGKMQKKSLKDLKRLAFLWFDFGEDTKNLEKVATLKKEELIDFLLEDFYWSELPEKHFLGYFEILNETFVMNHETEKYENIDELFNQYLSIGLSDEEDGN